MTVALAALVLAIAAGDGSHVYRWTDPQGHVHFSDIPEPNAVAVNPRVSAAVGDSGPTIDQAECDRRREQLESYRKARAISETNSLGEVHEYSGAERQRLIERTMDSVRQACGDERPRP